MAKIRINALTRHLQGRIGDMVFSRRNGKMIASLRPDRANVIPSQGQLDAQEAFKAAAKYARRALGNPLVRPVYEAIAVAKEQPVQSVAIGDFFRAPTIEEVNLDAYHGQVGDKIGVAASDDVGVVTVSIVIRDAGTQAVLEDGVATPAGDDWVYTATTSVPAGQPVTIEVTAKDRPGNETKQTKAHP